jgi:tetratricopeptide (TPR) repeat protein
LILQLHLLINIEWLEAALVAARKTKNQNAEGAHLGNLGNAYSNPGETCKAIEYYKQALKISREIGDRRGEGIQLFNMSLSLDNWGQQSKAVYLAKIALEIFEYIESSHAETVRKALAKWNSRAIPRNLFIQIPLALSQ